MTTIGLVGCGKLKNPGATRARDLYAGQLFRKAAAYAGRTYDRWFILSAHYGLIHPDAPASCYDLSLGMLSRDERRAWSRQVARQFADAVDWSHSRPADVSTYLHAGADYRRDLVALLPHVVAPLAGLGIGRQLQWYATRERGELLPLLDDVGPHAHARGADALA